MVFEALELKEEHLVIFQIHNFVESNKGTIQGNTHFII